MAVPTQETLIFNDYYLFYVYKCFACMCVPVHCVCLVPTNTRRLLETLELELHSCESPHSCWNSSNAAPPEEQSVLTTTEPPLSSAAT